MSLIVEVEEKVQEIIQHAYEVMLANRLRLTSKASKEPGGGRPRAQRRRLNATQTSYRRPEPTAWRSKNDPECIWYYFVPVWASSIDAGDSGFTVRIVAADGINYAQLTDGIENTNVDADWNPLYAPPTDGDWPFWDLEYWDERFTRIAVGLPLGGEACLVLVGYQRARAEGWVYWERFIDSAPNIRVTDDLTRISLSGKHTAAFVVGKTSVRRIEIPAAASSFMENLMPTYTVGERIYTVHTRPPHSDNVWVRTQPVISIAPSLYSGPALDNYGFYGFHYQQGWGYIWGPGVYAAIADPSPIVRGEDGYSTYADDAYTIMDPLVPGFLSKLPKISNQGSLGIFGDPDSIYTGDPVGPVPLHYWTGAPPLSVFENLHSPAEIELWKPYRKPAYFVDGIDEQHSDVAAFVDPALTHDGGSPSWCKNQALSLGFTPEDLIPTPPAP